MDVAGSDNGVKGKNTDSYSGKNQDTKKRRDVSSKIS